MPKPENQTITLKTYEDGTQKYIDDTRSEVTGEFKTYIDAALAKINKNADILEIGTATGRDADYIESKGYTVTRTDIVEGFLDYQRQQGKTIEKFDAINGNLNRQFDLILALAVFHHFTENQFLKALQNTKQHLKPGGYFALSLKQGTGEKYSNEKMENPRYFLYWTPEKLETVLSQNGFIIDTLEETVDGKWLQCIASTI